MQESLFRPEALAHQSATVTGRVILRQPRALVVFTLIVAILVLSVLALLWLQDYTRRTKVIGTLVPDKGLVRVYPVQQGRILIRHVAEGQRVVAGQPLFTLSSERQTQYGATTAMAVAALAERKHSLQQDLRTQGDLHNQQRTGLRQRVSDLALQHRQLQAEIASQRQRVALAETTYARYQELARSNFAPPLQVQQRADELLTQQGRLTSLQRNAQEISSQISIADSELTTLPLRHAQQVAQIQRDIAALEQETLEREAQRELLITAPISGTITALQGEPGQPATGDAALLAIIPAGSQLQAHFHAPSSAIGFIKPGQEVLLRYQAYPYQKFGQHTARIIAISRSGVQSKGATETTYRIVAVPKAQTVMAYGRAEALLPDMLVEADILLDRRRIAEWVLEPITSIKGKWTS